MSKKIVLTGGGTAGHVNPNIALLPDLLESGYEVFYIGSKNGIEKHLIYEQGIPYFPISTGKLRRYFDTKNVSDVFRVIKGISEAKSILKQISPNIIFSKGGFVSVPVVIAAHSLRIPIIIHESDATPGLANRISFRYTTKICASFPDTISQLPRKKAILTGSPIRKELLSGNKDTGISFCGFNNGKPVVMVMGGSIGSLYINKVVRASIPELLKTYNIVHLCGKGNIDSSLNDIAGYSQFEYIGKELKDIFAAADIIISRAGANAIFEILSLKKPNILIPLPSKASRGDQIINANSFKNSGYSYVLNQEDLNEISLISAINDVYKNKDAYISSMDLAQQTQAVEIIFELIEKTAKP